MAISTKQLRKHIFVHPGDQNKLEAAIKIALLKDRRKYLDSLGGALLDVNKIRMVGDRHRIVDGYISMEVVADFEVFSPSIGMELEGIINKKYGINYGCVVKGLFNAYLCQSDESTVLANEGDNCTFTVTRVLVSGDIVFMSGILKSVTPLVGPCDIKKYQEFSLSTIETEQLNNVELMQEENNESKYKVDPQATPKKKKKKKSKHSELNESANPTDHSILNDGDSSQHLRTSSSNGTCDANGVDINGVVRSIKSEPLDDVEAERNLNSETKSKKKHKKKGKSEHGISPKNEFQSSVSVKSEPSLTNDNPENSEDEKLRKKSKKKHSRKSNDGSDFDSSVNTQTPSLTQTNSKNKRKRKLTKEFDQQGDRKPVMGIDIPNFNSLSEIISPVKVKAAASIKTEPTGSPPKKKLKTK